MEIEGVEQQIFLQPEMAIVGAVYSVNGYTGHVVLTTSDLENTSGYQTSTDVAALISAHNTSEEAHPYIQALISSKQDPIVAGNGINITGGNTVAIDTTVVATQQNLATEVTNRENADIALQGQIDAISASSDVVDIVGTYAELQNYDTSKLKDNDIIKVLQDSTQGNATTYYRWNITTQTFTLIGQEGPYYTKAGADAQFVPQTRTINSKPLSANITLTASDVSALGQSDIVQTTGTSTSQVMSQNAVTTALATKLDSADVPSGFFDGPATTSPTPATSVELNNVLKLSELELLGDTAQDTTTGKNLINLPNYKQTENGIEWTVSGTNHAVGNGTTSSNAGSYLCYTQNMNFDITGDFTFSISKAITAPIYLRFYNDSNTNLGQLSINIGATSKTGTIPTGATKYRVLLAPALNTYYDIDIYLQLERGSSPTSIEPYTGAVPSPNPDYPQTVSVVTGTQTMTVIGKNLLPPPQDFEQNVNGLIISCVNGEYTINGNASSGSSTGLKNTIAEYTIRTGDYFHYNNTLVSSRINIGLRFSDNTQFASSMNVANRIISLEDYVGKTVVGISVNFNSGYNFNGTAKPMIVNGVAIATDFEPYQSQTYTVDLGATELCKIGNYQDYIYQGSDGWYIHKATGKRDVTSISSIYSSAGSGYIGAQFDVTDMASNSRMNGYCNILIPMNSPSGATTEGITFGAGNKYVYVILKDSRMASSTVANWNTWLASNTTTIYYPLATPTDTKITDSTLTGQLDALLSAQMYPEYTVISTNGDLPAILGITAYNSNLNGIIEVLASTASTLGNVNSALNIINNGGN